MIFYRYFYFAVCLLLLTSCKHDIEEVPVVPRPAEPPGFSKKLADAALERLTHKVRYDAVYLKISYPGGDVPDNIGVCTDEVIRSYRKLGIDLQKEVHEEMVAHFDAFPSRQRWGLQSPDTNIDHRRVPNLQVLFARKGVKLSITQQAKDYLPGDLVTWRVEGRPHIGIVVNRKRRGESRYMIVHNIGKGPVLEDMLFKYPITGHYRYYGS